MTKHLYAVCDGIATKMIDYDEWEGVTLVLASSPAAALEAADKAARLSAYPVWHDGSAIPIVQGD